VEINMLQQAHFLMVLRDYPEALKAYTSYLNTNAQDFEALIARSTAFYETGKYEESIDDAEAAMIIDRKRFEGYYRRGLAH
jgi:tetratricopeptide (TPR) repeat protein